MEIKFRNLKAKKYKRCYYELMTKIKKFSEYRFIVLLIIALGVFVGVVLTSRVQEIRRRAVTSGPVLYFLPSEISVPTQSVNQLYDIYLDTKGYEVNGAVFEIKFDPGVIVIKDIIEGDILRLVIDKSVEGGTAYLSVVIADETKPFVGVGKAVMVLFDTYITPATTYFTFEPNTQIHTKGLTSNILDKAIMGTVHIGLVPSPLPTQIISPEPTPCVRYGDADGNCKVDFIDFAIWMLHFGQATTNGITDGDFNNSNFVDFVDYAVWRLNFGT